MKPGEKFIKRSLKFGLMIFTFVVSMGVREPRSKYYAEVSHTSKLALWPVQFAVVPPEISQPFLGWHDAPVTILREGDSMTNIGGAVRMLKKEHDRLSKEMKAIGAALSAFGATYGNGTAPRGGMSAAGRARIAAAQRARWARVKAKGENEKVVKMPKKRRMSASARKRIAAAQRARWAKVKAAKKSA
jgi:hypothetical protein